MWNAVVVGLCTLAALGEMVVADAPAAVVSINRNNARVCLGTIVALFGESYQIITAAHCVYGKSNSELAVDLKSDGKSILPIQKVIVHPYYYPPSRDYDIAIIRAKKTDDVQPLLWSKTKPTDNVFAIEWNAEKPNDVVEGTVEERKSCKAKLSNNITVSAKMLCANIKNVFDGTPLMTRVPVKENQSDYQIVGIGSYYVKNNETLPKVFTNFANSEINSFIELYIP